MSELLIVLGKNIGIGSSPEDVRREPEYLSDDSRISALAAGLLYTTRPKEIDMLFAGGHTAGRDIPSEAAAMKAFTLKNYRVIPSSCIEIEEVSKDTRTNAIEVAKILANWPSYRHINLMSVGVHALNAAILFKRLGVPINQVITSESVLLDSGTEQEREFVQNWLGSKQAKQEIKKEKVRRALLATIDRKGWLLHQITQRTRS